MEKKSLRQRILVNGFLVAVPVVWIFAASSQLSALTPPADVTSLQAFSEHMPAPRHLAKIDDGGETKIVWVGDTALWALPSGPACYVFDGQGNLTEWDTTTGDGQATTRYLEPAWKSELLTVRQALDITTSAQVD